MSRKVSIAEAKNNFPALVHAVERGSKIEITRRGEPVAVLVSLADYGRAQSKREKKPDLLERLRAWRENLPPDFEDLTNEEVAAWRDRSVGREPLHW